MRLAVAAAIALCLLAAACDTGAPSYQVIVSFNTTVEQADLDEVRDLFVGYDPDVDFLVQESFPPTGVARLETDVPDFCRTVTAELEGRSYLDGARCEPD